MNSGTENIYWGVLLVFAFLCTIVHTVLFSKKPNKGIDKENWMLYNAIKDKKRVISIIWVKRAQTVW